jgi:hypothetical protein
MKREHRLPTFAGTGRMPVLPGNGRSERGLGEGRYLITIFHTYDKSHVCLSEPPQAAKNLQLSGETLGLRLK